MGSAGVKVPAGLSQQARFRRKDGLFPLAQVAAPARGLRQRYRSLREPLASFAPGGPGCEESRGGGLQEERPVTPIRDSVKVSPASLEELCQLVHRRVQVRPEITAVSEEAQRTLAGVILAEVKLIWQDLKNLTCDPSLSSEENEALRCQMTTRIILVCEQLFLHYLCMVDTLRRRCVFSDQANLSRLGAQLSVECTRLLRVPTIRRSVIAEVLASRKPVELHGESTRRRSDPPVQESRGGVRWPKQGRGHRAAESCVPWRGAGLPPASKNRADGSCGTGRRTHESVVERDLREIHEAIAPLDLEKVYELLPFQEEQVYARKAMQCAAVRSPSPPGQRVPSVDVERHCSSQMKGYHSMPDLYRESLLEELGIKPERARPNSPVVLHTSVLAASLEKPVSISDDLRRLLQDGNKSPLQQSKADDPEADLPPLIRAVICRKEAKWLHVQETLKKLNEEEEQTPVEQFVVKEPEHPQAAIEASTVKWLDRNLFLGQEIKDVYKELTKSVSTEYLDFDQDPLIERAAADADMPIVLASSALNRKRRHWFINPQLREPNRNNLMQRENKKNNTTNDYERPDNVSSRAYASWLQWWKSTLNFDDYLKYISTQDSDYLKVIFHLYNSDESDDEEDERRKALVSEMEYREREQRKKIAALRSQKQEFVSGLWNVNSVMLGGLGKEPELGDADRPAEGLGLSLAQAERSQAARSGSAGTEEELLQSRLERIWEALYVPDGERLDMAIKYSSHTYRERLEEATTAWERAVQFIQQRESLLAKLERFERNASDPNRFFERGYRGTSIARLDESKRRGKLHSEISAVESLLSKAVHRVKDRFNDTVTYKGRPYAEKMRWDKIEMLYWLQQGRRMQAMDRVLECGVGQPVRLPPLQLPPQPGSGVAGHSLTHPTPL
nr:PREDICTED: coiled-coil domain-containing protein 87 isoform X2 [Lepisosteus oculatus]